mmetsp:Transcript_58512/g.190829  ORF Transcript_58512/g.190829 Transcript_58512/m.190829 type:complete len:202 (-) Transcript_58512:386-991(-)
MRCPDNHTETSIRGAAQRETGSGKQRPDNHSNNLETKMRRCQATSTHIRTDALSFLRVPHALTEGVPPRTTSAARPLHTSIGSFPGFGALGHEVVVRCRALQVFVRGRALLVVVLCRAQLVAVRCRAHRVVVRCQGRRALSCAADRRGRAPVPAVAVNVSLVAGTGVVAATIAGEVATTMIPATGATIRRPVMLRVIRQPA